MQTCTCLSCSTRDFRLLSRITLRSGMVDSRSVAVAFFLRYTLSKRSVFLWVERFMAKGKRAVPVGTCFTDSVPDTVLLPHKQFFAAHQYGK